jgi:protein-tyrosine phosphatase
MEEIHKSSKYYEMIARENQYNEVVLKDPITECGGIYIASLYGAEDLEFLKEHKITHVLSVIESHYFEPLVEIYKPLGLKHLNLNCQDTFETDISPHFSEGIEFIESGFRFGNVLVHCQAGRSRSCTLTIAWYMTHFKEYDWDKVYRKILERRPSLLPNYGFRPKLVE